MHDDPERLWPEKTVAGQLVAVSAEQLSALESELAALRQIVADMETCQQGRQLMVEGDRNRDFKYVKVGVLHDGCYKRFHAETWQAALHAAAEWVRAGAAGGE